MNSLKPGRITITAPRKPKPTAIHLLIPTFSFNKKAERNVTIIGETKCKVIASVNEIIELTPSNYKERRILKFPPESQKGIRGAHHFNSDGAITAFDFLK